MAKTMKELIERVGRRADGLVRCCDGCHRARIAEDSPAGTYCEKCEFLDLNSDNYPGIYAWAPKPPPLLKNGDGELFEYEFRQRNYPYSAFIPMDMPSMVGRIKIPDEPEPLPVCHCGQTIWNAEDECADCQTEGDRLASLPEDRPTLGDSLDRRIAAAKARDVDPTSDWSAWSHPSWES
jgi:hypothetical protein